MAIRGRLMGFILALFLPQCGAAIADPFQDEMRLLCSAISKSDVSRVTALTKVAYFLPNERFPSGNGFENCGYKTPLDVALGYGSPAVISVLLAAGADDPSFIGDYPKPPGASGTRYQGVPYPAYQRAWLAIYIWGPYQGNPAGHDFKMSWDTYVQYTERVNGKNWVRDRLLDTNGLNHDFIGFLCESSIPGSLVFYHLMKVRDPRADQLVADISSRLGGRTVPCAE